MDNMTLYRAGIDALTEKLGPVGMAKFMRLVDSGHGDYTKERSQWLEHIELDELFTEIEQAQ
jgi:hypothetical protein